MSVVQTPPVMKPTSGRPARRWPNRAVAVAAVTLAWVVFKSSQRVETGPECGTQFAGVAAKADEGKRTMRIATFNIHGGEGLDGRCDLCRTADALRCCDLVGLNEVHGRYAWESCDQAEWLGRELGAPWIFAPTEERWWHYRFGNAMLSKLRIDFWQRIPLPSPHGRSYRNAVVARAVVDGQALNVVVTHFDRSDARDRAEQWRAVAGLFLSLAQPAVLLGDLNTEEMEPPLAEILAAPGVRDPLREILGDRTPRRIDWILTRGLRTLDAGFVNDGASDHPCVWAEVAVEGAPSADGDVRNAVRMRR
jgi:endonuclease/exonuclease/phosphatase family metal-dependent hydrolase